MMDWFNPKHVVTEKLRILTEDFSFILFDLQHNGICSIKLG